MNLDNRNYMNYSGINGLRVWLLLLGIKPSVFSNPSNLLSGLEFS